MKPSACWAFDLDGCLVGVLASADLRPLAREVLERLRAEGIRVVVWSAGGAAYAKGVAERLGIAELIDGFYDKVRGADGKWRLDAFLPDHLPAVCVDDEPDGVPASTRAVAVTPYLGRAPHDRGLAKIIGELDS